MYVKNENSIQQRLKQHFFDIPMYNCWTENNFKSPKWLTYQSFRHNDNIIILLCPNYNYVVIIIKYIIVTVPNNL